MIAKQLPVLDGLMVLATLAVVISRSDACQGSAKKTPRWCSWNCIGGESVFMMLYGSGPQPRRPAG